MQEEIAFRLASLAQAGRAQPVHERRARTGPVAGIEMPGERRPGYRAGVVVKGNQRIELVGCEWHGRGAQYLGLVPAEVGPEQPQRLPDASVEIGRHAAR